MSNVIREIDDERHRQIRKEGWAPEHDDEHGNRELARAAQCYLEHYIGRQWLIDGYNDGLTRYQEEPSADDWPWDEQWWKPKNPRRDLIRVAALLVAEIERMDRASHSAGADHGS